MRFSLTMEDSLVEQIDKEARQTGTTRAEWIRTACTDALTTEAPEEPRPDPPGGPSRRLAPGTDRNGDTAAPARSTYAVLTHDGG